MNFSNGSGKPLPYQASITPKSFLFNTQKSNRGPPTTVPTQSPTVPPLGFLWRPQQVPQNPRTSTLPWLPSPQPTCFGVYVGW